MTAAPTFAHVTVVGQVMDASYQTVLANLPAMHMVCCVILKLYLSMHTMQLSHTNSAFIHILQCHQVKLQFFCNNNNNNNNVIADKMIESNTCSHVTGICDDSFSTPRCQCDEDWMGLDCNSPCDHGTKVGYSSTCTYSCFTLIK